MKITLRTANGKVLADFTIKTKRDHSQFYDAFSHMCHYQEGAAHPPGSSREEAAAKVRPLLKRFASDSMSAFPIGQSCLIKTVNADQTKNLKITLADCTNLSLALSFIMEDPNYLGQAEAP